MSFGDRFQRGDADGDGREDISDAIFLLNTLFLGGPESACADAADFDDNGVHDLSDSIFLLNENFGWGITLMSFTSRPPDPAVVGERWRTMWLERLEGLEFFRPYGWSTRFAMLNGGMARFVKTTPGFGHR